MITMNIQTTQARTDGIPEWGTEECMVWWESQYNYAESHNIQRDYISHLEWADGFVGK